MTAAEQFYASIPFAPGEAPFHIKGTTYIFHDRWVEEKLPGGREAQREALGALRDDDFFENVFVGNGMYDVFPLVALGYACADVRGESMEAFCRMRARSQAELDLRHVRKWLVKLASPTAVAKRFPKIITSYFDFGEPEDEAVDQGVDARVKAVPEVIASWLVATFTGFGELVLEVNGARNVRLDAVYEKRPDEAHGLRLCDLRVELRWS